jgi:mRNA interferase RelE/StbE
VAQIHKEGSSANTTARGCKIVRVVEGLIDNPFPTGCRKLVSSECAYRIRVGNYWILYEVFPDILIIEIIRVAHRRKAYEE